MNFELIQQRAKLANVNLRAELEGEDRRPACDLKFEFTLGLGDLAQFGSELRAAWYNGDDKLRNPQSAGPHAYTGELVGATLTVHHGLGGKSDLVLSGCTVNRFALDPQDGGTIQVALRVQCHPSGKDAGRLYELIQSDVDVSLAPAQATLPGMNTADAQPA